MEIIVSLLIIALGIAGFGMAIPMGRDSMDKMREERTALLLAKQMVEEIQSKAYEEPNLPPGSFGREEGLVARVNFDDIDDYDGLTENPPQYSDGNPLDGSGGRPDYRNFQWVVVVDNVADNDFQTVRSDGSTASKRITVTVSSTKTPPSFDDVVIRWVANREGMGLLY